MSASERLSWVTCPSCGSSASVGWRDGILVAVYCPGGCRLASSDFAGRRTSGLEYPHPVAPRTGGRRAVAVRGGPDTVLAVAGSVGDRMTRCPRCASSRIGHHWRTDMARLTLIDEWKCLDTECGHRWATSVTFAQLLDSGGVPSRTSSQR